jgi:NhaP-type Na+/H+ or K+/H+ antiporter
MTDPIEVIEKLEHVGAPHTFVTTIEMESLLNDATGILLFFTF